MAEWVKMCSVDEVPAVGAAAQFSATGVELCLVNANGELAAMDAWCPHRHAPLAEGWLEDGRIICPWHAWSFDLQSGECPEERSRVRVYPLRQENDTVFVDIG